MVGSKYGASDGDESLAGACSTLDEDDDTAAACNKPQLLGDGRTQPAGVASRSATRASTALRSRPALSHLIPTW